MATAMRLKTKATLSALTFHSLSETCFEVLILQLRASYVTKIFIFQQTLPCFFFASSSVQAHLLLFETLNKKKELIINRKKTTRLTEATINFQQSIIYAILITH